MAVFGVAKLAATRHAVVMQKATPLILVFILAIAAICLSLRPKVTPPPPPLPVATAVPLEPAPKVARPPVLPPPAHLSTTETSPAKVPPQPWPQATSDIAPDAGITFGTLDNGLRYII